MENKKEENKIEKKPKLIFRAINQYVNVNVPDDKEVDSKRGFIAWGSDNNYPDYLNSLYKEVTTLHSIIEGIVDFVSGDAVEIDDVLWSEQINTKGETIQELVRNLTRDYMKYGGFAINVVRNRVGAIGELHFVPFERLRTNEDCTEFYYSKEWDKSIGRAKFIVYPKFDHSSKEVSSIFYFRNNTTDVYPVPLWSAAINACEIEKAVNTYHLNGIKNGFSASYFICLNNGIPDETEADEIEQNIIEKYTGEDNAARVVINFAEDKDHSAELTKLETDDTGEKYQSLIERTKSELFTAFRAIPNIFGLPTATGFSNEEYSEAFGLFNRTMIKPIQYILVRVIKSILNKSVKIVPFTVDQEI